MLQTLTGNIWTHKMVVDYSQLLSGSPDFVLNESITTNSGGGNYHISTPTPVNLTGMTATVISGTGNTHTAVVGSYTPNASVIFFSPDFSPTLDTTSVIQFTRYNSYKDFLVFGIPANHIIVSTKFTTLVSFDAGTLSTYQNSVYAFIGDRNMFPIPVNGGDPVVTSIHSTYGVSNLTVPTGSDATYEYGTFRWFTVSAPGDVTYARNPLPGNPTTGSYCTPLRLDARDVYCRFCIFDYTDNTYLSSDTPHLNNNWNFNSNVTTGTVEIAVQYMAI